MNPQVQSLLTSGAALTDAALEELLPAATTPPHSIHRAMRHSTFAGGKRLRPILCMEAARMVAGSLPAAAPNLGAAIEMVHTYSLIHDDLPALDNDDLRRGKPTCHVAFGEAIAILAGDALQTLAFQTIAHLPAPAAAVVQIMREFSLAIGTGVGPLHFDHPAIGTQELPPGMIGGQVMDIESEAQTPTSDLVERIHRSKTGALITTSIVCGGLLGLAVSHRPPSAQDSAQDLRNEPGAPRLASETWVSANPGVHTDILGRMRTFGEKAGLAFQIVDDVLDMTQTSAELGKTAGKDTAAIKATWPAIYMNQPANPLSVEDALARARHDAAELIADAFAALAPFGDAATPLKSLAQYLVERTH